MHRRKASKLPAIIMAGGLGKRAEGIDSTVPKPLISINGKPILQWEIECLVAQGYNNIILTVSHMADKIQRYFGDGSELGCYIQYYVENQPLGNAGALLKLWANKNIEGDFLLLNADSMFDIDFDRFISAHISSGALATIFTHPSNHIADSGLIMHNDQGWVEKWLAKEDERPRWYHNCANAGLHVLNTMALKESGIDPAVVGTVVEGKIVKVDLDRQILKPLSGKKKMLAVSSPEYVRDMGTPKRFEQVCQDLSTGFVHRRNLSQRQRAVFLDRDGTINKYVGFLRSINDFVLVDGVAEAMRFLNQSGYLVIVVTNQPVIARGELTEEELQEIHNKMETLLGEEGAYVDGIYYCPHHPNKGFNGEVAELKTDCECRKPKPGMLLQAAKDYNIDLSQSWMIGDNERDIQTGINAGCNTILLYGDGTEQKKRNNDSELKGIPATRKAKNLLEAVKMIL